MRIGTWNLSGDWGDGHLATIEAMDCDVLLLTEVRNDTQIPGMHIHPTRGEMVEGRWWAAVASRTRPVPLPDPHGTSALARVDGLTFCSSVLPWNGCRPDWPFPGNSEAEWTAAAVTAIEAAAPDVWGGDWNHTLSGSAAYGSKKGRDSIVTAIASLGLTVVTAKSAGRRNGMCSIDHLATPNAWVTLAATVYGAVGLSDHDAYAVQTI